MIKKFFRLIVVFIVVAILVSPMFIKVKVECKSQIGDCPEDLNKKLSELNNKKFYYAKKQSTKILKSNMYVSNYLIQFKLPNTLMINVVVYKPIFSIFNKEQNKYLLIDINGVVLSEANGSNYPILIKDTAVEKSGQKISDRDLYALKIIQGVYQMYQIGSGTIQNDTLVVDMDNGLRVIFPLEGIDISVLLGSLRLIYTKVTTNYDGIYSQIDLRFKNPILR